MRCLGVLLTLALFTAPGAVLAQHHGGSQRGSHSHSGSHSHGGSHSYTPRTHSHYYSSPRPYHERHYTAPRHRVPRSHTPKTRSPRPPRTHATPAPGTRGRHGKLRRSEEAKRDFERQTGHPHGWPGHVIDHKVPLAEGGADTPGNMQWQTVEEAKAKDKVECAGKKCG